MKKKEVKKRGGKKIEEEKATVHIETKGPYTQKPSAKFSSIKTADPFASNAKKHKTTFGYVYTSGGIPCKIKHGGVSNHLEWDVAPAELSYDPLLSQCFEGILETEHPYSFVAFQGLKELLLADGACEKTIPMIPKLVVSVKSALMHSNPNIFSKGLDALQSLIELIGESITPHAHLVLAQLGKGLSNRKFKQRIIEILTLMEEQGGPDIFPLIKSKIPTYSPFISQLGKTTTSKQANNFATNFL